MITEATSVDVEQWFSKLPENVEKDVAVVVEAVVDDAELPSESQVKAVVSLHSLVPEYPYYHWRHLDEEVQDAIRRVENAHREGLGLLRDMGKNRESEFACLGDSPQRTSALTASSPTNQETP